MNTKEKLDLIASHIYNCKRCDLHKIRNKPTPGIGSHKPRILFVGRNPGEDEDKVGIPFVGKAGKLVYIWIDYLSITKSDYAIINLAKCFSPDNAPLTKEQIEACSGWTEHQIKLLNPEIIVALGGQVVSYFMKDNSYDKGITKYGGKFLKNNLYALPHPSFFARRGNTGWEKYLKELKVFLDN